MASTLYQNIPPSALAQLGPEVRRIDVREPDEFIGPLGHLPGAELVPLGTLEAASADWPREHPLLLICRSASAPAMRPNCSRAWGSPGSSTSWAACWR